MPKNEQMKQGAPGKGGPGKRPKAAKGTLGRTLKLVFSFYPIHFVAIGR